MSTAPITQALDECRAFFATCDDDDADALLVKIDAAKALIPIIDARLERTPCN